MKEGLSTAKAQDDPHVWMDVEMEVVIAGTRTVLYKVAGKGGVCQKCRNFATLPHERWNPYDANQYPCKPKEEAKDEHKQDSDPVDS